MPSDFFPPPPASPPPELRRIQTKDVRTALCAGWRDFRTAPWYGLFFGGVYFAGGLIIFALLAVYGMPWLVIPIAIGFPLLGPFVASGLYEISRRIEQGLPVNAGIFGVIITHSRREFAWMAFIVLFIFWIWIYQIRILLALFLGDATKGIAGLPEMILSTPHGLVFLGTGTLIGTGFAVALFAVTVIGMPLLMDREHDIITAITASVQSVLLNPVPMLLWGMIVGAGTMLAMLPVFSGLMVVFPVFGHATWHLYRRVVAPL